jgi:hypothetical protein
MCTLGFEFLVPLRHSNITSREGELHVICHVDVAVRILTNSKKLLRLID